MAVAFFCTSWHHSSVAQCFRWVEKILHTVLFLLDKKLSFVWQKTYLSQCHAEEMFLCLTSQLFLPKIYTSLGTVCDRNAKLRCTRLFCSAQVIMKNLRERNLNFFKVFFSSSDWYSVLPSGPEDLLQFSLRDLKLAEWHTLDLPLSATYRPSVHHPYPVNWSQFSPPTEPEQFTDAIE